MPQKNGIYTIIDYGIMSEHKMEECYNEAYALFSNLSVKYKDNPYVLYEICNEPENSYKWYDENEQNYCIVRDYALPIIRAIRAN